MFEAKAEAEAKALKPRPRPRPKFWPRGHFGLEDLTSLSSSSGVVFSFRRLSVLSFHRISIRRTPFAGQQWVRDMVWVTVRDRDRVKIEIRRAEIRRNEKEPG